MGSTGGTPATSGSGTGASQGAAQQGGEPGPSGGAGDAPAPAAAAPQAPAVPPVISPPRVLSTGTMAYPGGALSLTLKRQDLGAGALAITAPEGVVQLRALVQVDGSVRSVEVVVSSGSAALDRAASEAVGQWRFAPATRDGTPIDAYVTLRIRYVVR